METLTLAAKAGRLVTVWTVIAVCEGALLKAAYGRIVKSNRLPGDTQEWPQPFTEGEQ